MPTSVTATENGFGWTLMVRDSCWVWELGFVRRLCDCVWSTRRAARAVATVCHATHTHVVVHHSRLSDSRPGSRRRHCVAVGRGFCPLQFHIRLIVPTLSLMAPWWRGGDVLSSKYQYRAISDSGIRGHLSLSVHGAASTIFPLPTVDAALSASAMSFARPVVLSVRMLLYLLVFTTPYRWLRRVSEGSLTSLPIQFTSFRRQPRTSLILTKN